MNILQSFMGCMYPGSIRTESIESMDHDYAAYRFQATNIDEHGNEVSRGELQLTDRDLIYFRPGRHPTRWPIGYIRRYGCEDHDNIFIFEAGRRCTTGEAVFAFRLNHASELGDRLKEKIDKFPNDETSTENETYDDVSSSCRFGRLIQHSQSDHRMPNTPPIAQNNNNNNNNNNSCHRKVPHLVQNCSTELAKLKKRDASTSTETRPLDQPADLITMSDNPEDANDPRPLSYALIDFDTTKALNESAQAHAASRVK